MHDYARFFALLGIGLAALSFLLQTFIDIMFTDWDPVEHYSRFFSKKLRRDTVLYEITTERQQEQQVPDRV